MSLFKIDSAVDPREQRLHPRPVIIFAFGDVQMAQAKTLTERELKKVLTYISLNKHAARNRAMLLMTHWAGMRVGEVAALRIGDVVAGDGSIKHEIRLQPEQTKVSAQLTTSGIEG
jgi:integrase